MAKGALKELTPTRNRTYYDCADVQQLLGVSRSKAYAMIRDLRNKHISKGVLYSGYPDGKIPKKIFDQECLIK